MDAKRRLLKHIAVIIVVTLMLGTLVSFFVRPALSDAKTRKALGLPEDAYVTDTERDPWVYANEEGEISLFADHMIGMDTVIIPDAVNGVLVTGIDFSARLLPASKVRTLVFPKSFSVSDEHRFWLGKWESLEVIAFEEGATDLAGVAIYDMPALKEVYLPKSVTGLYTWGLQNCAEDVIVYYAGTEEEWWALGKFAKATSEKYLIVFDTPVPTFEKK